MANYLEDRDLYYEIVLSKGKGNLTRKAEHYLELIANNTIRKIISKFSDEDEMRDCLQHGILILFENWYSFDEKKFKYALPYFSEICKRGFTAGYNELHGRKAHQQNNYIKFISLDSSNDGKGLHHI
jgi:hypothetical protein